MKTYEEIKPVYDHIFTNLNGYAISLLEKTRREVNEPLFKDILYGEVSLELLYALYVLPPLNGYVQNLKTFYDLGSGIGNAVISSHLTGLFDKCVGIELLDTLYNTSLEAKRRLVQLHPEADSRVQFIHDNILNVDFSAADLVLFCCPTQDSTIRSAIEQQFQQLRSGSIILSLIHQFADQTNFKLLDAKFVKVAWGETPLRIYQKISN